jgi:hypothetical protein
VLRSIDSFLKELSFETAISIAGWLAIYLSGYIFIWLCIYRVSEEKVQLPPDIWEL